MRNASIGNDIGSRIDNIRIHSIDFLTPLAIANTRSRQFTYVMIILTVPVDDIPNEPVEFVTPLAH